MKAKERIALIAKTNGLKAEWQDLKYGFSRAKITCDSSEELEAVKSLFGKKAGVYMESWAHRFGEFEGCVYAMSTSDYEKLQTMLKQEEARVEAWWQRYHVADAETKRLMACGTIA